MQIHTCVKEKGRYFENKFMTFQFINNTVIFLSTCVDYYWLSVVELCWK